MKKSMNFNKTSRQSGVTLVELLIAMLIGAFLVGGILQVFAGARQTYRVHDATSRMQESGRMALEVLSRDIRMADFWGCASKSIDMVNNLDPDGVGYDDVGDWSGIDGEDGGSGPDLLILRGGIDAGIVVEGPYGPNESAVLHVNKTSGLAQDDIVMVSDCSNGDIFQISNANPEDSGTLVHNTGYGEPGNHNASNPGCSGANAHCLSKVYNGDAKILLTQEIRYEIKNGSEGQPALFRDDVEFLDGIEDLQIVYGEDTDDNGIANYFVPADQVADMDQVISIRIAVVARSYDDNLSGGVAQNYNVLGTNIVAPDLRLRQVYTSTIAVRNRL